MSPTPDHRVIASFSRETRAREVVARLRDRGVPPTAIRVDDPDDRAAIGRIGQRGEGSTAFATPGALGEERTMRAGWFHSFAWGAAGAVLGAVLGLLVDLDAMSEVAEVLTFGVVGALALGTAGFVFGMGRGPDVRPGPVSPAGRTLVSVQPGAGSPDVAELLRAEEPEEIWDAEGIDLRAVHDQRVGRVR